MFRTLFNTYHWEEVKQSILTKTDADVRLALQKEKRDLEDFKALISPAASFHLETMAQLSHKLTQKRFGKKTSLFLFFFVFVFIIRLRQIAIAV